MTTFWAWLMGLGGNWGLSTNNLSKLVQLSGYAAVVGLHILEMVIGYDMEGLLGVVLHKRVKYALRQYPDLIVLLNVIVCFCAFAWMYGWTVVRLWRQTIGKTKME